MLNNVEGDAAHNFCPAKCLSVQGSCGFRVTAQRDTVPCSCVPWGKMQMGFVWGVENYRMGFANLSASGGDLGVPAGPCSWTVPALLRPGSPCAPGSTIGSTAPTVLALVPRFPPPFFPPFLLFEQAQRTCCVWGRKHKPLFFIPVSQNLRKMQLEPGQKWFQLSCHCAHTEISPVCILHGEFKHLELQTSGKWLFFVNPPLEKVGIPCTGVFQNGQELVCGRLDDGMSFRVLPTQTIAWTCSTEPWSSATPSWVTLAATFAVAFSPLLHSRGSPELQNRIQYIYFLWVCAAVLQHVHNSECVQWE